MIPGFNHTVMHHGTAYHVQTEDSGLHNPVITTHLFLGGNVLAARRTSYAEVVGAADLETRVRKAMQEQHKEMLRQLIRGAFDREGSAAAASAYQPGELATSRPAPAAPQPSPRPATPPVPPRAASAPASMPTRTAEPRPAAPMPPPLPSPPRPPMVHAAGAPAPRAAARAPAPSAPLAPTAPSRAEEPPVLPRVARQQPPPVLIPEIEDEDLLSDRRLDEVILAYLAEAPGPKRG